MCPDHGGWYGLLGERGLSSSEVELAHIVKSPCVLGVYMFDKVQHILSALSLERCDLVGCNID